MNYTTIKLTPTYEDNALLFHMLRGLIYLYNYVFIYIVRIDMALTAWHKTICATIGRYDPTYSTMVIILQQSPRINNVTECHNVPLDKIWTS